MGPAHLPLTEHAAKSLYADFLPTASSARRGRALRLNEATSQDGFISCQRTPAVSRARASSFLSPPALPAESSRQFWKWKASPQGSSPIWLELQDMSAPC